MSWRSASKALPCQHHRRLNKLTYLAQQQVANRQKNKRCINVSSLPLQRTHQTWGKLCILWILYKYSSCQMRNPQENLHSFRNRSKREIWISRLNKVWVFMLQWHSSRYCLELGLISFYIWILGLIFWFHLKMVFLPTLTSGTLLSFNIQIGKGVWNFLQKGNDVGKVEALN